MIRDTFDARDIWTASYLIAMNVPLREAYVNEMGRMRWCFGNEGDRAWQMSRQWHDAVDALVNGPALAAAYREATRVANSARRNREFSRDDRRDD